MVLGGSWSLTVSFGTSSILPLHDKHLEKSKIEGKRLYRLITSFNCNFKSCERSQYPHFTERRFNNPTSLVRMIRWSFSPISAIVSSENPVLNKTSKPSILRVLVNLPR